MIKRLLAGLACALALATGATAAPVTVCDSQGQNCLKPNADGSINLDGGGPYGGMTATLLSNVNAATTGVAVPHVYKDSYLLSCVATTWNSATAALQYLGPDGSTWLPFSPAVSLTSNGSTGVGIGANATVRAAVTGTPTGLTCGLS